MTRLILRALNAPLLLLLVTLGVAALSSLFTEYPLIYLQPNLVLIAVIWCALRRPFIEGGILTLIIAENAEIHILRWKANDRERGFRNATHCINIA